MRYLFGIGIMLLSSAVSSWAAGDSIYKALREAGIKETFTVDNLVIQRDNGTITLKSGTVGLTAPQMGRDTVAVFQGDGEFAFTPVLPMEASYLRSMTGKEAVAEKFDRAMFLFTDANTGKELRAAGKAGGTDTKLDEILRNYRKMLRRDTDTGDNLEAEILRDLYNPSHTGFFSAYFHGKRPDLRFFVKPRGAVPSLPSPEEVGILNMDLGGDADGIWYLSHFAGELQANQASSAENKRSVAAESYKIDTTIAGNDKFNASTELHYKAMLADRVIQFSLRPTLRVTTVTMGGKELDYIQEDKKEDATLYVILPEPMKPGAAGDLRLEYAGDKVVHKEGGGNFSVGARESWYPNVNTFRDHAKYDLTFRVPKRYTLVSVGNLEKSSTEKDAAVTHWVSDKPIAVAGFNYGDFKRKEVKDTTIDFTIEGYAATSVPDYLKEAPGGENMSPSRLLDSAMAQAQNAMRVYSNMFGKSEFGRVAITQQPEFAFGQSWPSLVYLPVSAFLDSTQRWQLMGLSNSFTAFIDEVTAHEVAHQWWGHMVGWETFHDQWLSEGFADFSAAMYLQFTEKTPDKFLKFWETSRKRLIEKNNFGKRANDSGPIWMGTRLERSKNDNAYFTVTYNKGAYVLYMLRQIMWTAKDGQKPFVDMMHDFVQAHMNRNATTESFQAIAEKYMTPQMDLERNHKLNWFFREWVYGTQVPKYKFEPTLTAAEDGKWLLKATLTQSEVDNNFAMLVPLYADFDGKIARLGTITMVGNTATDKIQVLLPSKPKRVMINAYHDVLEM